MPPISPHGLNSASNPRPGPCPRRCRQEAGHIELHGASSQIAQHSQPDGAASILRRPKRFTLRTTVDAHSHLAHGPAHHGQRQPRHRQPREGGRGRSSSPRTFERGLDMNPSRRQLLQASTAAASLLATHPGRAAPGMLLAPRLKPGDTLGLVSPANATFEREPLKIAVESLQALGFKVKLGRYVDARRGPFAGTDAQRAGDINVMFADDGVAGVIALTGGSGCNRIVDQLDYELIKRKPKFFGGFSDLTSLVNAIHRQTGLVTFHSPVAGSEWNDFSVQSFKAVAMNAEAAVLRNPVVKPVDDVVAREERITTIRPGRAHGRLVGGNLTVLASLAGSAYFPECRGAILFLEDVNEY
ncbi:MAG: LD-carboxypeptidase, partial [Rubrivivax sp.]